MSEATQSRAGTVWTPEGEMPAAQDVTHGVSEQAVVDAVSTVYDPEIPVNIYELGLIYAIDIEDDGAIKVEMTLTAPGCPSAQELPEMVRQAILSVPGVDAALIGPTDLSVALGVGGQMEHPTLVKAIEDTMAACARHQVVPAIHTNDVGMTAAWARKGMRLVSINSEVGLLTGAARGAITTIRSR